MSEEYRKIVWEIVPVGTPHVIRHCHGCRKKSEFVCSGQFRVNANKASIDVWLIYKCESCGATWNMSVVSRQNIKRMDRQMYEKYIKNDAQTALDCSFDVELLRKNAARADFSGAKYEVKGEDICADELCDGGIEIVIKSQYRLDLRLDKLIKDKLGISRSGVYELAEAGRLIFRPEVNLRKQRIGRSVTMLVERAPDKEAQLGKQAWDN